MAKDTLFSGITYTDDKLKYKKKIHSPLSGQTME